MTFSPRARRCIRSPCQPRADSRFFLRGERVPEPLHGADRARADGRAHLGHKVLEVRHLDHHVGPQRVLKLRLAHRARTLFDEQREEVERFRREVHVFAAAREQPRVAVEHE
jgi:hypothetical protein